jgi:hypothetical protein
MSSSCVHDRYAETSVHVNEEDGHAELHLIYVAASIALSLRSPKLLRYNGTTGPDRVVENPGVSILRTNGRTEMRRRNEDQIGAAPVTHCSDRCCISPEEMDYIGFRISWGECVGNVTISKVVVGQLRQVYLQDFVLKGRGMYTHQNRGRRNM